jgi:DNA-directed RNA polymerase III subunit RPC2
MTGHEIHSPLAYMVFVNGLIIGVHTRPVEFAQNLRQMRRQGLAGEFVSVSLNEGQRAVHIATDGGRVCRPLIIVDKTSGLPKLKQKHLEALASQVITIRDLLRQGVVEYVDCNEENNTLIALTERDLEIAIHQGLENRKMHYTHLEIDPLTILGVIGGIIPVRY